MRHATRSQRRLRLRPLAAAILATLLGPGALLSPALGAPLPRPRDDLPSFQSRLEEPIETPPSARRRFGSPPAWMGDHFHFQKGYGLEYRHILKMGAHPLEFGVQGPVIRKKKRLGVTLVVRF